MLTMERNIQEIIQCHRIMQAYVRDNSLPRSVHTLLLIFGPTSNSKHALVLPTKCKKCLTSNNASVTFDIPYGVTSTSSRGVGWKREKIGKLAFY
jgi:hypothetical protein